MSDDTDPKSVRVSEETWSRLHLLKTVEPGSTMEDIIVKALDESAIEDDLDFAIDIG